MGGGGIPQEENRQNAAAGAEIHHPLAGPRRGEAGQEQGVGAEAAEVVHRHGHAAVQRLIPDGHGRPPLPIEYQTGSPA